MELPVIRAVQVYNIYKGMMFAFLLEYRKIDNLFTSD